MKTLKYFLISLLGLILVTGCQNEDFTLGDIVAPSNLQIQVDIVGSDANNPNGDGSGVVKFKVTADNAISYQFVYNGTSSSAPNGEKTYTFSILDLNTYAITAIAYGTGGASSSKTVEVEVLSLYEPPADLITMLTANSSRTWKINTEAPNYFGLGPIGTTNLGEYYPQGQIPDKSNTGMYDDRYTFNVDGTFTHDTGPDGKVFGRDGLIEEIGGPGDGTFVDPADIINYSYPSYSTTWTLTAPGGVETLSLGDLGFIGYYVGGTLPHSYRIFARSADSMTLMITDGNNQFDWNFILIPE